MKELVSIIIPTFNRAHLIVETLDSILDQTYDNWECIIIDDGSEDETKSLVLKYVSLDSRFKYFARPENLRKGPSTCRNYGLEKSTGKLINWFDDDDIMLPTFLESKVVLFRGDVDAVICKLQHYDFKEKIPLNETNIYSDNLIEDYLIGKVTFFVSGPMWTREFLLKQSEIFDVNISNLDDWDFNLRMLYANPNYVLLNEALVKYRVHKESLSQKIKHFNFQEVKSELNARKKHLWILIFKRGIDLTNFRNFTLSRNIMFLRESLVLKDDSSFFLFKNLIIWQFFSFNILRIIKTSIGFISYNLTGKGYRFLK